MSNILLLSELDLNSKSLCRFKGNDWQRAKKSPYTNELQYKLYLNTWDLTKPVMLSFCTKNSANPLKNNIAGIYEWSKQFMPHIRVQLFDDYKHPPGLHGVIFHELSHHLSTLAVYSKQQGWKVENDSHPGYYSHGVHKKMTELYLKHLDKFKNSYAGKNSKEAVAEVFRVLHGWSYYGDKRWCSEDLLSDYLNWFESCPIYSKCLPEPGKHGIIHYAMWRVEASPKPVSMITF